MEFSNISQTNNGTTAPAMSTNIPQPQPQIIFVQAPKFKRSFERYPSRVAFYLGCIQIGTGIMSIILGIANPLTCGMYGMVGIGIWGGILYIVAGAFGILSAQRKTSHTIIVHLVLSVIAAACGAIQLAISAAGAYYDNAVYGCYYYDVINEDSIDYAGTVAVDGLLALFGIVEGIVAILASAISCKVICCSSAFVQQTDGPNGMSQGIPGASVVYLSSPPQSNNQMASPYVQGSFPAQSRDNFYHIQMGKSSDGTHQTMEGSILPGGGQYPPNYERLA